MADKYANPTGKQPTSLLLSPPGSGFRFDTDSGNALLLPITQSNSSLQQDVIGEADRFVGQQSNPHQDFPGFSTQSGINAAANLTSAQQRLTSSPPLMAINPVTGDRSASGSNAGLVSNLHLPLRSSTTLPSANNFSSELPNVASSSQTPSLTRSPSLTVQYKPVDHHWFYCKEIEKKNVWIPFSLLDSEQLEEKFTAVHEKDLVVSTDGGRYDVHLKQRMRHAVFWEEEPTQVRRCSWFYRGEGEKRYIPYEEHFASKLEEEYHTAVLSNSWHRRLEFPGGETVIIHNPSVVVHFLPSSTPDEWGNVPRSLQQEGQLRPRVVKRGVEEFDNIVDGEAMQIDHLVFVVHGIGGFCDLKFRTVTEVVDDFRSISNNLLRSHFRQHVENQAIGRIEFLPISWHETLHGDDTGIDTQLQPITLPSIPKLRYFSNDTILDVLFYTSPVYCQTIVNQVCSEINRMYRLFLDRNPTFTGNVSLIGHSLGSVILFDILLHQRSDPDDTLTDTEIANEELTSDGGDVHSETSSRKNSMGKDASPESKVDILEKSLGELDLTEFLEMFHKEKIDMEALLLCSENDLKDLGLPLGPRKKLLAYLSQKKEDMAKKKEEMDGEVSVDRSCRRNFLRKKSLSTVNYVVGLAGTGQPFISYPSLDFKPSCFFALGSPTAMFLTVRGLQTIGQDFKLPTCRSYFNVFHPFDPVAYRMEPLVDPSFTLRPILIPHHKGRKRMHLEIKESLARVGSDLKQMLLDSLKSTWNSINDFARAHGTIPPLVEAEMEKMADDHLKAEAEEDYNETESQAGSAPIDRTTEENVRIGSLNGGRRFDYVLQEKPIESFNEYLFALQSHMCYWESEDTVLLFLTEIYSSMGIKPMIQVSRSVFPYAPMSTSTSWQRTDSNPVSALSSVQQPPPSYLASTNTAEEMYSQKSQDIHSNLPAAIDTYNPLVNNGSGMPLIPSPGSIPNMTTPPLPGQEQSSTFGMDPTLPPASIAPVGPPPLTGFVRQSIRK